MRRAAVTTLVGLLLAPRIGLSAPLVVRTFRFHGADEIDISRAHLPPGDFEVVDLSRTGGRRSQVRERFARAVAAAALCSRREECVRRRFQCRAGEG